MENRNGLLIGVDVCHGTGNSESDGALRLIDEMYLGKDRTLGADKGYDAHAFVAALHAGSRLPAAHRAQHRWSS